MPVWWRSWKSDAPKRPSGRFAMRHALMLAMVKRVENKLGFANDTDDPRKVVAIFAYKVLWTDTVCNFEKPAARPDPADILTLLC